MTMTILRVFFYSVLLSMLLLFASLYEYKVVAIILFGMYGDVLLTC